MDRWWWFVLPATAVSSLVGLRGNMWIWSQSVAGDLAFVVTSVLAFVASRHLARWNRPAGVLLAFPLHWVAYMVSWSVTIQEGLHPWFVLRIGWAGLLWCCAAVYVLDILAEPRGARGAAVAEAP